MSDDDSLSPAQRGADIVRRRLRLGIKSTNKFGEVTGIDRGALGKVEAGVGSKGTLDRVEAWLDDAEEENAVTEADDTQLLRISMRNVKASGGIEIGEVIAEGNDPDALAESMGKLLERLTGGGD